jgi:DNA-binding NarL/FixJ family response regulator
VWKCVQMGADDERIRVLVVDDHAVVRSGLLAFLEGESDLEVVGAAEGGAEALDLLERLDSQGVRPDVILMDLQMTPVDGIESTRRVRSHYDDVEVVALTSFGEPERVQRALEAGASGYLLKDADADEVTAAIRAAHRGELQLDPAVARRLMSTLQEPRAVSVELTARELDVVALIGEGNANKEIALKLGIGERTARTHVSNILRKLGLTSRTQLALWAVREQLVNVEAAHSSSAG